MGEGGRRRDEGMEAGTDRLPGREVVRLNYGEVGELMHTTCGA